ncbi:MAG TPA: CocE/NonD family hydrolase [Lacipirellulaceae bacterium]|nr:CocE/NonD family hydrolase [Lacipirellulaceae bacterium]
MNHSAASLRPGGHDRRHGQLACAMAAGLLPLLAAAATARAEIQTLYRGAAYTEAEGAARLDASAAQFTTRDQGLAHAAKIRQGILRGARLEKLPAPCPLATIRHSLRKRDGYTVENVAFESLPGFWVTGNLYLPLDGSGPLPGILCPHGHGADPRMNADTQARAAALARMGAAAFAYDMVGVGESTQVPHKHSETLRLQLYNSLRAVDFLLSLGMVDDGRLAATGESGGATQTFLLAAVDPRIDVSAPVVQVSAHFYGGCVCESGLPIHKSAEHETNNVEIAASFAPKPQLIVSDGADWTRNVARVEFPYIRRIYELHGAAGNVENAHFANEGHDYGPSKRAAAYRFMARHLGLELAAIQNAEGEIDEGFFEPLAREELCVFTPARPRPSNAIENADEVILRLDGR